MLRLLRRTHLPRRRRPCPYGCGQRIHLTKIARHWWLDHAGDPKELHP